MPQFDPWTNDRLGFPRKDSPAFQREWKGLSSSAVEVLADVNVPSYFTLIEATSSVGVSGTIHLWGLGMATSVGNSQQIMLMDDEGNNIITMQATDEGPYFIRFSCPITLPINSKLTAKVLNRNGTGSEVAMYITPMYTSTYLNYE